MFNKVIRAEELEETIWPFEKKCLEGSLSMPIFANLLLSARYEVGG